MKHNLASSQLSETLRVYQRHAALLPTFLWPGQPLSDRIMNSVVRDLRRGVGHTVTALPFWNREPFGHVEPTLPSVPDNSGEA